MWIRRHRRNPIKLSRTRAAELCELSSPGKWRDWGNPPGVGKVRVQ
jgi:hypothetical protein